MREMKDSGVAWLGEIPDSWEIARLKYVLDEPMKYGATESGVDYDDSLFRYIRITDITTDGKLKEQGKLSLTYEQAKGYILRDNAILFARSGGTVGKSFIYRSTYGKAAFAGYLISAYANTMKVLPKWILYYTYCNAYWEWINLVFTQATIQNIGADKYSNMPIPVAPLAVQKTVIGFLDTKCAEIDVLTADIQSQIDTLEQYKRSVITETVTKGLNLDTEMKESGIEWVGKIPTYWNVHPVYVYFGERKNKNRLGLEDNLLSLSYGHVIQKDIDTSDGLLPESFNTYNIVEAGDIIVRPTDLQNDKRSLRTGLVKEHGIITSAYIALRPLRKMDTRYFHFLLHSFDVMKVFYNMGNGVRQGLNFSEFSHLMIFEPSYEEQTAIADYLDTKVTEIDAIIAQKRAQIETLNAYKKSLIFEYVTGKKEVPNAESETAESFA